MALTLVIANKNYSSWSMRPWVLLTEKGIAFEERLLKFHSAEWSAEIAALSPTQLVPVLWEGRPSDAASLPIWDTLAIAEYLHETFPDRKVWPADPRARATARSASAEMHSGFRNLRNTMPMNIRNQHPGKGLTPETAKDIARIEKIWAACRREFGAGGPFLFGEFSAADAMFAPVAMRFNTYHPPLSIPSQEYVKALSAAPSVAAWVAGARQESDFVPEDEPYSAAPGA